MQMLLPVVIRQGDGAAWTPGTNTLEFAPWSDQPLAGDHAPDGSYARLLVGLEERKVTATLQYWRPSEQGRVAILNASEEPITIPAGMPVATVCEVMNQAPTDEHRWTLRRFAPLPDPEFYARKRYDGVDYWVKRGAATLNSATLNTISIKDRNHKAEVIYDPDANECCESEDEAEMEVPVERTHEETIEALEAHFAAEGTLKSHEKQGLLARLKRWWRVYSDRLGRVKGYYHTIDTTETKPAFTRGRTFSPAEHEEIAKQEAALLERDLIEPSDSDWATGVVLAKKKDGTWRFAIDYRALDTVTVGDKYPLPRVDETLDALAGARYYTALDLRSGFWQLELSNADARKTAFRTRNGLFQWKVMAMGLKNATASFQRMMERILGPLRNKCVMVYVDDLIIYSDTWEQHLDDVEAVMKVLDAAGLTCKLKKCEFGQRSVEYLGHPIGDGMVRMAPHLTAKIEEAVAPSDKKQVRQFMGLVGYYRHFVREFAHIATPLTAVMGKNAEWIWGKEQQLAFTKLRAALLEEPILRQPDFKRPFEIHTDASAFAVGGTGSTR
jgi:hypothetical protein